LHALLVNVVLFISIFNIFVGSGPQKLPGSPGTVGKLVFVATVVVTLDGRCTLVLRRRNSFLKTISFRMFELDSVAQGTEPLQPSEAGFYAIIRENLLTETGNIPILPLKFTCYLLNNFFPCSGSITDLCTKNI
jgi:hypothetical protein